MWLPFPKSKVVSPHWATTGAGFIRWNDNEFFLKDALIHVGHVWGTSHSKKWVWVHSHGFEENPTAVFEGLWAPICGSLGMSMCWFQLDGKLTRFTNFGSNWKIKKLLNNNIWDVKLSDKMFGLNGTIQIDPSQVAGITYHDPDGSRRCCYNSKISTIRMNVNDKQNGDKLTLTAPGTAAFEVCFSKELKQFSMLV